MQFPKSAFPDPAPPASSPSCNVIFPVSGSPWCLVTALGLQLLPGHVLPPGSRSKPLWRVGNRGKMQRITIFTADGFLAEVPLSWPFLSFPVIIPYLRMKKLALCVAWYSNSCLQSVISSLSAPCYVRFTVLGQAKMFSVETANGISYSEWSSVGFKVAPKAVLSSFSSIISVCFQTGENECSES